MNMETVNLEFVYQLGARTHALTQLEYTTKKRGDICELVGGFKDGIQMLFDEYPDLTVCKSNGQAFLDSVKRVSKWESKYLNQKGVRIDKSDAETDAIFERLLDRAKKFEIVLLADLRNLTIYHPLEKGGYNTQTLLSQAEQILGKDIVLKLGDDVTRELREFGRCLVFDNYTASGFHILRALEIVLHNYYIVVCEPSNPKRLDSWWEYLTAFKKLHAQIPSTLTNGDKDHLQNVINLLDQIRLNHRNLIMHPEVVLDESDSLHLANIAKTAIGTMTEKL